MTPGTDKPAHCSQDQQLTMGDWDVMFCAVLARLNSVIEPLDLKSPPWSCLPECLESLQLLRQSALLHWEQLDHTGALTGSGAPAPAEPVGQMNNCPVHGERP